MQTWQSDFSNALRDLESAIPPDVVSHNSEKPLKRFAVHRNNVMVGLVSALEARFPATRNIVGEEFFNAAAKLFAAAHPPRSPIMMLYGDAFPPFLAGFEPAREVPYLADVARLEAARTRAYHAADAEPLTGAALRETAHDALAKMHFAMHPSLEIVDSPYPIVTIWAMNSGEAEVAPIAKWHGEDALVLRPAQDVEVRRLPAGAKTFLQSLARGLPLQEAADAALAANADFDITVNIAALFAGLATAMSREPYEDDPA